MSLQVWLPLNGDLDNFGLDGVKPSGNIVYDANGKIGKCGRMDSQLSLVPTSQIYTDNMSVSFWMKSTASSPSWHIIIALDNISLSQMHGIYIAEIGRVKYEYNPSINVYSTISQWHHYTYVLSNGKSYGYLDGELKTTSTEVMTHDLIGRIRIGAATNSMFLNDVRIYNHCLSAKEVKELAKGLVLHYRLAGPGQENFILESHKVTSGGASTGITRSYTSEGYLKVVSAASNGFWCNLGFAKDSNANVGNKLSVGDTYTMSVEIKVENGTILPSIFINSGNSYKKLQGTIKINQWVQYSYTAVWNTPGTDYGNISLHLGFGDAIGTYYFRNFKLEKGSIATSWCPAPGDALYNALGYNNNIEYDCSGYRRNGTKIGTITWDIDSPRYTTSYKWPAASSAANRIISPSCIFDGKGITMAVWVKFTGTTAGGGNYHMPLESSTPGYYEMSVDTSGRLRAGIYVNGTRYVENCANPSMYDNKWHHIAITYNGSKICRYVDGKAYVETNVTGTANGLDQAFYIGSYGTTTTYYNNNIWESDARVYATALSAEDIAELYHSAVIVDNTGKLYAYEYFEAN